MIKNMKVKVKFPHHKLEVKVEVEVAPPDSGRSVNPISTRGKDYAHLITTGTPGFSDIPTALSY